MGVRGLIKFIKAKDELNSILESYSFPQMTQMMIIDGSSLFYSLYFQSDLDKNHGGDYSGFKEEVCRFFDTLLRCKVKCHVILDGGSDPDKQKTLESRLKDKLKTASEIATELSGGTVPKKCILPPLIKDVFIQILREKDIIFQQCFGEADQTIAHLANKLNCPALSNDSDFYIFDLREGFLPLDDFQWKDENNGEFLAKRYKLSKFCEHFRLDPALMPVFASIAGNDYSCLEFVQLPSQPSETYNITRLQEILKFLGGVDLTGLNVSEKRKKSLTEAFASVSKTDESTLFLHSIGKYTIQLPELPELPFWFLKKFQNGELTSFVRDVWIHKKMMLTPLVEDFSQPSCYHAARRIRQYFYGLILGNGNAICIEYDRKKGGSVVSVNEVTSLLISGNKDEQNKLQLHHLNKVLKEALDVQSLDLKNIPKHLQLPLCVASYWWRYRQGHHSSPANINYLHALLLGFLYELHNAEPGAFKEEMGAIKVEGERRQLDLHVAHAFSQWQVCMRQSLHLNQLLCCPLPKPACYRLYCGPLVHQLTEKIKTEENAVTELKNSLNETQRILFEELLLQSKGVRESRKGKKNKKEEEENKLLENNRYFPLSQYNSLC
ncbi:protein asteroid homolog 1-like isoform X2 [Alosa sapidissima]|uniref:protein asteroid homolog 1-like isoform X2 n=1 Tax=Alosa sapidissima TaxID=34773 RepID=UPI001C0981E1|nr:protein asteroid homolog 1-like isoform X2 [Alosa sapidissima]